MADMATEVADERICTSGAAWKAMGATEERARDIVERLRSESSPEEGKERGQRVRI